MRLRQVMAPSERWDPTGGPLAYMVLALGGNPVARPEPAELEGLNRTDRMRRLLATGPAGARELAACAGVTSAMVGALLKADLRIGRVVRTVLRDGRVGYQLSQEYDAQAREAIVDAIALLKRHGFKVIRPK